MCFCAWEVRAAVFSGCCACFTLFIFWYMKKSFFCSPDFCKVYKKCFQHSRIGHFYLETLFELWTSFYILTFLWKKAQTTFKFICKAVWFKKGFKHVLMEKRNRTGLSWHTDEDSFNSSEIWILFVDKHRY